MLDFVIVKKLFLLSFLFTLNLQTAEAYSFNSQPESWTDAEVESFLFLSQMQKKTALNGTSRICIDISEPLQGGKQQMRIISKVGDNAGGGLFQVGKSEIEKSGDAWKDVGTIKTIVDMSSGYQQAIMDYDPETEPLSTDAATLRQYMSAEVIGYTDGLGVVGSPNASLNNTNSSLTYTSNKTLGKYRANYLASELGLADKFGVVNKTSKESETALKDDLYKDIRNCDTWRTAEVRLNFQTGSKVTDEKSWIMSTKMMPEKQRAVIQYESSRQAQEAMKELNFDILFDMVPAPSPTPDPNAKTTTTKTTEPTLVRSITPEYRSYCSVAINAIKAFDSKFKSCVSKGTGFCFFNCGDEGDISINPGSVGTAFGSGDSPISFTPREGKTYYSRHTDINAYLKKDVSVKAAVDVLNQKRKDAYDAQLKKSFPECAKSDTAFADLKALVSRIEPYMSSEMEHYSKSIEKNNWDRLGGYIDGKYVINAKAKNFVDKAVVPARQDNKGVVTQGLKCIDMKRAMSVVYAEAECKTGEEFTKVSFPHKNAKLGCVYCGSGWNVTDGAASYKERDTLVTTPVEVHDHGSTSTVSTVDALRSPGIHEISDCPGCNCTDKGSKLAKIYTVEKASDTNLVPTINTKNCYCTPPIIPSCGVGPSGKIDAVKTTSLGQKYFFDACTGKFEKVSGDSKAAQITNLLNTLNKGCVSDPTTCAAVDIKKATEEVNAMLCERQNYKIPTNDPVVDCSKEDGVKAQ